MSKIVIGIACHKPFEMPQNDLYLPIAVGAALRKNPIPGTQPDNEGDNISELNPHYCELTAQYWLWKNVDADYYGLCHYRRYLSFSDQRFSNFTNDNRKQVLVPAITESAKAKYHLEDENGMREIIESCDIIAPESQDLRRIYTPHGHKNSVYKHFAAHDRDLINVHDLDTMIEIVHEKYPQYAEDLDEYLSQPYFRGFNCFVMKKEIFRELCAYEFDVLDILANTIDMSSYSTTRARVFGFMAEIISSSFIYHLEKTRAARVRNVQMLYVQNANKQEELTPWNNSLHLAVSLLGGEPWFFAALAQSFIEHMRADKRYDIVFLISDITTSTDTDLITSLFANKQNVRVKFVNWDEQTRILEDETGFYGVLTEALTCGLPWILKSYESIVLLQSNIMLENGWDDIFNIDLKGNLIAGTKDVNRIGANNSTFTETRDFDTTFLGLADPLQYMNSSIVIMDLERIRTHVSLEDIAIVLSSFNRPLDFSESTNVIFENNIKWIDQKFNVFESADENFPFRLANLPVDLSAEYAVARKSPVIQSYDILDPYWADTSAHVLKFWSYARKTPFYEPLLSRLVQIQVLHGRGGRNAQSGWRGVFNDIAPIGSRRREIARALLPWNSPVVSAARKVAHKLSN